jgi:hypothetical protein
MDIRTEKDKLKIKAENLPQFYELLAQAKEEAQQLNDSISKLSRFEFDILFSVVRGQPEEDMEEASSTSSSIPT